MKFTKKNQNLIQWIGGGSALLGGLIYVITQFSNINYGLIHLEKTINEKVNTFVATLSEKTNTLASELKDNRASIQKLERRLDRVGQKLNDEIIPFLNMARKENQRRIKEVNLSKVLEEQKRLHSKYQNILDDIRHIYSRIEIADSFKEELASNLKEIQKEHKILEELDTLIVKSIDDIDTAYALLGDSSRIKLRFIRANNAYINLELGLSDLLESYTIRQLYSSLINKDNPSWTFITNPDTLYAVGISDSTSNPAVDSLTAEQASRSKLRKKFKASFIRFITTYFDSSDFGEREHFTSLLEDITNSMNQIIGIKSYWKSQAGQIYALAYLPHHAAKQIIENKILDYFASKGNKEKTAIMDKLSDALKNWKWGREFIFIDKETIK